MRWPTKTCVLLIFYTLIGGCTEEPSSEPVSRPELTFVKCESGREEKDPTNSYEDTSIRLNNDLIIEISGREPDKITPPNDNDYVLAKQLNPKIADLGLKYIKENCPHRKGFSLSAARRIETYILLCFQWWGEDGNIFLVWSTTDEKIIGRFTWYIQG